MSVTERSPAVSEGARERGPSVSVVIPCLNEAENIDQCVHAAATALRQAGYQGEVIVVDNGSEDASAALATAAGARVVSEQRRGYGSAYLAGLAQAQGDFIVMADADLTYDFKEIPRFVERLQSGAQLVIGDRMDNIEPGAMPWLHRYVGNPVLTGILNMFFRAGVRDAHCGMRALRRDVLPALDLRTSGMEFASEMLIRASREGLAIEELPISYRVRGGTSKLSRFTDGWRHLRVLLVYSPTHLFIVPGALMAAVGLLAAITSLANLNLFGRHWQLHTLIGGALLIIVGIQVLAIGLCAHAFATYYMGQRERWFDRMQARLRLEHGLMLGTAITLAGLITEAVVVIRWIERGLGSLAQERLAVVAATLIIVGVQVFFTSFLLSILGLRRSGPPD